MARVTVEDCVERIPNRFELVMLAAQRARNIGAGALLSVDRDNDKNPVVALREIAAESVSLRELENNLVQGMQRAVEFEEPGDEEIDLAAIQRELDGELGVAPTVAEAEADGFSVEDPDGDNSTTMPGAPGADIDGLDSAFGNGDDRE